MGSELLACLGQVCGEVRQRRRKLSSIAVYATVFQAEIFANLACGRDCMERNYTREQTYIC
jgi:hypothetical protein